MPVVKINHLAGPPPNAMWDAGGCPALRFFEPAACSASQRSSVNSRRYRWC
jgi:hypothetical protein